VSGSICGATWPIARRRSFPWRRPRRPLSHPHDLIPPSIDPLIDKNCKLEPDEVGAVCARYEPDRERPLIAQISRFDRFKGPAGVIQAYQLAKHFVPGLQLVLAGGTATDDPEGESETRPGVCAREFPADPAGRRVSHRHRRPGAWRAGPHRARLDVFPRLGNN
jgi:glycosyltransferase involved in cell wall biosynthesis